MEKICICPHCNFIRPLSADEWVLEYNCPITICPNCKREYLIEGCKELSITKISLGEKLIIPGAFFLTLIMGISLLLHSISIFDSFSIFRPKFLFGGIGLLMISFIIASTGIKNFGKKRKYLAEEMNRSQSRCANPAYIKKLEALGYQKK